MNKEFINTILSDNVEEKKKIIKEALEAKYNDLLANSKDKMLKSLSTKKQQEE